MALTEQPITINFSNGVNTKIDPFQLPIGQFEDLSNIIFQEDGKATKRNGFGSLTGLPVSNSTFLTTFNGALTAIGTNLYGLSESTNVWINKGFLHPVSLSTLTLIRSNTSQTQVDAAVAPNGLTCVAYTDAQPSGNVYKYAIVDSATGQNVISPTAIPAAGGSVSGSPRVFVLGNYFVILFTNNFTGTNHLQYIAINTNNPLQMVSNTDISTTYTPASTVNFDAVVANNNLFVAWNGSDVGGAVRISYIDTTLTQHNTVVFANQVATIMSVTADNSGTTPVIYVSYYDSASSTGHTLAVNQQLSTVLAPTSIVSSGTFLNIASTAINGVCTVYLELSNTYSYDASIHTNLVKSLTVTQSGTVTSVNGTTLVRSVGLASKAFLVGSTSYFLGIYYSVYQPTYFLFNSSGQIISKLAYENAGSYYTLGLPGVSVNSDIAYFGYLYKDLITAANTSQNATSNTPVYAQTGLNLAIVDFASNVTPTAGEIGSSLHLSGGLLWQYDGYQIVEHGFFLFPDSVEATWSTTGGNMAAQPSGTINTNAYAYQVVYEWTDNQGMIHRSAPSIPVFVTTTGTATTGSVTLNIPTLRLTYKTTNPVRIMVYRWSVGQQNYYSIFAPSNITSVQVNSTTTDSIQIIDPFSDAEILGNALIYTTGSVLEDIAAPATNLITLFDTRLWLLDAEDQNLLWFSKQVIEGTPVEMSDLLTMYIAPTVGAQGSTGFTKAFFPMDDKLILFKTDAAYYINGQGPDNTGANNQYSNPIFIVGSVGCSNQQSIVLIPNGLMFQSDKGIWLLGRDLQTSYIGAQVEKFTLNATVTSAVSITKTTQVRFTLDSGVTLMYDYYFNRWSTFTNISAISSTLYQGYHTFVNDLGAVYQETPGQYLDGTVPVLMSLTTGWINLAGINGYERFYQMLLLGEYITPFKLNVQIGFDYAPAPSMSTLVTPNNYTGTYGSDSIYGDGATFGGPNNALRVRIFPNQQKVGAFQISLTEVYDGSFGVAAGAGLTLSGLTCVVGVKKGYRPTRASQTFG